MDDLPLEELPEEAPHPMCVLLGTPDPEAFIRFDMSAKRAALLAKKVHEERAEAGPDELVQAPVYVGQEAYRHLHDTVGRLAGPGAAAKNLQVIADPEPEISVGVAISDEQVRHLADDLARRGPAVDRLTWAVPTSTVAATLFIEQVKAAVRGEDPTEALEGVTEEDLHG
ncbi:hypothetical protein [Halomarina oriensis]|uniref:Uncharacterized protein n=1 Tax=Halomarina oriensis TaxID=671145 RepID=A0A6B0GE81_9EURY|nr:hypothetical protein [Halomarina oriensis]MWG33122.1 hypothetical protein [Halomarina oriensis]